MFGHNIPEYMLLCRADQNYMAFRLQLSNVTKGLLP